MPSFISEHDIEQALLQRLQDYGYEILDCHASKPDDLQDGSGRSDKRDTILADRLREAAIRLNPQIPEVAVDQALARLLDKRARCRLSRRIERSTL